MSIRVDLSPKSSLTFEREKEEVQKFLLSRKNIVYQLDWGADPFDQPIEPFKLAFNQFKKDLLHSSVKSIILFPLTKAFFQEPLQPAEKILFEEEGYERIDLFRRDRLNEFLVAFDFPEIPLILSVDGPSWWLHPTKFPWIERKKGTEKTGLLLPNIETNETLSRFQTFQHKEPFRLLTEETLGLEWEGLANLWYIPEGVTPMGMRVLRGFEAAGGILLRF